MVDRRPAHAPTRVRRPGVGPTGRPAGRPDLSIGAFTRHGPWRVEPPTWPGASRIDAGGHRRTAPMRPPGWPAAGPARTPPLAAPGRHRRLPARVGTARLGPARPGYAAVAVGTLPPAAPGLRAPGPHLHQTRADHLLGRGHLPRGAGGRVPPAARPGAAGTVLHRPPHHRRGARTPARRGVRLLRPDADRVRLDRPGPRRHPPIGGAGGGQGPTADRGLAGPAGHRRHVLDRTQAGRPDPCHRADQPARPRRPLRRDHRRGARLPARSPEHARHRCRLRCQRAALGCGPAPTSRTRHHPGAGHGAPARVRLGQRRRHAGGRHRHRGGPALQPDRLPRGHAPLRGVPRRPARRQPPRAERRHRGPPRLRDHRSARRAKAAGLPPPPDGRDHQRRHRSGRGPA